MTLRPDPGLVQSLLIKAQRIQLDEIGRQVGTPVVYLKAAWADPALYGGRGERVGGDIDILVRPERFEAFAQALVARGFKRHEHGSPSYERYFGHKEWSFEPPRGNLAVDLHRALTEPIWYDLAPDELIDRAVAWDSVDGPLLSLDPEDQLLYAAAHYANHFYDLDDRHLQDCRRLLAARPIDWATVWARATRAQMRLPVALMVEALQKGGTPVGHQPPAALGWRRRLAALVVSTSAGLGRRRPRNRALDYLFLHPLLSDRPTALPRIIATYGVPWLAERLRAARS